MSLLYFIGSARRQSYVADISPRQVIEVNPECRVVDRSNKALSLRVYGNNLIWRFCFARAVVAAECKPYYTGGS